MAEIIKTVLVTGAQGAVGRAVCAHLLAAEYTVVGTRHAAGAPDLEPDPTQPGQHWVAADVTDAQSVRALVQATEARLGPIDALIHCAGGFRWTLVGEASDADLDFLLDLNLRSSLLLLREVLPGMKSRNRGRVVLISSRSTLNPGAGEGPYAATKAAVNALTQAAAAEVKTLDVTVNAVLPSVLDTPANRAAMPDANFAHWVKLDELAEVICTLIDPMSAVINGALIPVAGKM